jgi:hypothetical protein
MTRIRRLLLSGLPTIVVPVLLYVPFRLLAMQTNNAFRQCIEGPSPWDDSFAYPIAVVVWPTYMFLVGLGAQLVLRWWRSEGGGGTAAPLAIITSYCLPLFDGVLGIHDLGVVGFTSVTVNTFGSAATPLMSLVACPVLFVIGSLLGYWLRVRGREAPQRDRK